MTREELREAGHEQMSALQALRAHCLACAGRQEKEVALCPAVDCPAWPFRTGHDPWRKPASEARREAARRTMADINARRGKGDGPGSSVSPPDHGPEPAVASKPTPAPTWSTAHVDRAAETEQHRGNRGGGDQNGDQFADGRISDGSDMTAAIGEPPEGRAA
jgi:hypothetical protein